MSRQEQEMRARELALREGPMVYALLRAMQRMDIEREIGYVGDADVLASYDEAQQLRMAQGQISSVARIQAALEHRDVTAADLDATGPEVQARIEHRGLTPAEQDEVAATKPVEAEAAEPEPEMTPMQARMAKARAAAAAKREAAKK